MLEFLLGYDGCFLLEKKKTFFDRDILIIEFYKVSWKKNIFNNW